MNKILENLKYSGNNYLIIAICTVLALFAIYNLVFWEERNDDSFKDKIVRYEIKLANTQLKGYLVAASDISTKEIANHNIQSFRDYNIPLSLKPKHEELGLDTSTINYSTDKDTENMMAIVEAKNVPVDNLHSH